MENSLSATVTASTIKTPFDYCAGINYESWTMGRTNMNIAADLTCVAQHFSLIKTFHCAGVGTTAIEMDSTQQQVIDFVANHQGQTLQLIMGTNNSALAQGGFGTPWSAGLMNDSTYTDSWVSMLISSFGNAATVLKHLKCICLGNEIDANGPPPTNSNFKDYYETWIPNAFKNLKASMAAKGLGSISISTTIANYPLGDPSTNVVASSATACINSNWGTSWNNGNAFVFFNQYTENGGQRTDFNTVSTYFDNVQTKLGTSPQVFVGETGYSAEFNTSNDNNEAAVITDMFNWLNTQRTANGACTPLCVFQAFDHSDKATGQKQMGLFEYSGSTAGPKSGISIPAWVNTAN